MVDILLKLLHDRAENKEDTKLSRDNFISNEKLDISQKSSMKGKS